MTIETLAAAQAQAPVTTRSGCDDCVLKVGTLCRRLDHDAREALHRYGRRRTLAKGQIITWQGEPASHVANVLSGVVKLSATTADGREQILDIVGPGGFLGRIDDRASAFSAIALGPVEICLFPRESFLAAVEDSAEAGAAMLERALEDLDRTRRWLLMIARGTAIERVATLLLAFAERDTSPRHAFALTRGQMADLAGLTIETVSRQIGRLKASGIIALPTRDSFEIRDAETLRAIAGEQPGNRTH
jgi:CRP/FNR family transcriptional regulator